MVKKLFTSWARSYWLRRNFTNVNRTPFFNIAYNHLPTSTDSILLDIGPGEGEFARNPALRNYPNLYLLEGNPETVETLRRSFKNVMLYRAPETIPFEDASVSYIHCSHLIEHLHHNELYQLLKEMDRVLKRNGIIIISTPMLWNGFYRDLSHVKPYNPEVLINYMCEKSPDRTNRSISDRYTVQDIIYRYQAQDYDEGWGSTFIVFDFVLQSIKYVLLKLGIKRVQKNGYMIILKKN
jgi:SAM-dependent methyltransferase